MAEKKISFGFKQVKKQPLLLPIKHDADSDKKNGIELIQCLEGQTIKLVHEKEELKPLVIPLLNSQKTSSALAVLKNLKNVLTGDDEPSDTTDNRQSTANPSKSTNENGAELSLEQRVIKELLHEAQNIDGDGEGSNNEKLSLPLAADKLPLDGAKESSIEDYDNIPIAQFGLAMLRGMGLKDEEIKAGQNKEPELRPKGMGLGADKVVKKQKLLVAPAANETLEIKKNAYVRVLGGKHKDLYGQIEGLDDHACRVIVRMALGGSKEAFNEFMVQAVSKQEYQQYGKVINSAKYEEYKRKQEEKDAKKDIKTEVKREKVSPDHRRHDNSRPNREASPKYSKHRDEYASSSRHRSRDRSRDRERARGEDRRDSRRSPSYDRNRTKATDQGGVQNSRHDNRRSRSIDRPNKQSNSTRIDRPKEDKYSRHHDRSPPTIVLSDSSSRDSDSPERHSHKKSHHKKSKKKHKKKSSKKYDSSDDDCHIKKRTKKSKRERSRSR